MRICIVGGGIVGLTTGLYLQRRAANALSAAGGGGGGGGGVLGDSDEESRFPISDNVPQSPSSSGDSRLSVTVLTDRTTPHTTADGAAGIWGPYLLTGTPLGDQERWARETHDMIEKMWNTPGGGKDLGIALQSSIRLNGSEEATASWRDVVYGFRRLTPGEVSSYGRLRGSHGHGFEYVTYTLEPARFLPQVLREFRELGGRVRFTEGGKKVTDLASVAEDGGYDLVINCTGVWAGRLAGDDKVKPLRGQVMRLKAPWLKRTVLDDADDGNYVISNQDTNVWGGTHQNSWDSRPSEEDSAFIRGGCRLLMPADAKGAEHLRDWVGLRPGRTAVRVERERVRGKKKGKEVEVVHNYGHGGSGITIFWGTARDAYKLAKEVQKEVEEKKCLSAKL